MPRSVQRHKDTLITITLQKWPWMHSYRDVHRGLHGDAFPSSTRQHLPKALTDTHIHPVSSIMYTQPKYCFDKLRRKIGKEIEKDRKINENKEGRTPLFSVNPKIENQVCPSLPSAGWWPTHKHINRWNCSSCFCYLVNIHIIRALAPHEEEINIARLLISSCLEYLPPSEQGTVRRKILTHIYS